MFTPAKVTMTTEQRNAIWHMLTAETRFLHQRAVPAADYWTERLIRGYADLDRNSAQWDNRRPTVTP